MTQQLLWEEYRQANPNGYQYSRFCELYRRWRRKQDVVLRQEHKPGEKLFVDWAGTTIPIHDPRGGPVQQAHLFVAVLGASSYTYAEPTADEQLASWIGAHVRAFEFYQGVPKLVVPDNTKTGITKAVTIAEHRPRSHQAHLEWTPSRMVHWAQTSGPHTAACSSVFSPTSRTRRCATDLAWASFGSLISTHGLVWKPRRNGRCFLERVVIRASSRS